MSDNGDLSASGGRRTGWAELTSGETVKLAGPAARLGARVLDIVILALAAFIITPIFFDGLFGVGGSFESALLGWVVLMVMTSFAYEVIQIAVWGQTLGKRATGIRVINAAHGGLPGWGKAIGRWAVPSIVSLIPIVGALLWILCYVSLTWDRVYQGWHDKAAGTLVVRA